MDNLTIIEIKPLTFQIKFFLNLHTNDNKFIFKVRFFFFATLELALAKKKRVYKEVSKKTTLIILN